MTIETKEQRLARIVYEAVSLLDEWEDKFPGSEPENYSVKRASLQAEWDALRTMAQLRKSVEKEDAKK